MADMKAVSLVVESADHWAMMLVLMMVEMLVVLLVGEMVVK